MWILPFTWPAAAAMTALFVAVAVPLAIIAISLGDVLHITSSKNIPGKPGCFDEDTKTSFLDLYSKVDAGVDLDETTEEEELPTEEDSDMPY